MNLTIETNKCLQAHNSLALAVTASHFCCVSDHHQIIEALAFAKANNLAVMPLGAGSNVVLAADLEGLVVYVDLLGVIVTEAADTPEGYVDVTFCAGEDWHEMVLYSLKQGWYGLENLSLIPGNMGAAAIQNIGAYGVELSDLLVSLKAVDLESGESFTLTNHECQFSYRDSVFKQSLKDKCIITDITLRLSTHPVINLEYPALKHYFHDQLETLHPSWSRMQCVKYGVKNYLIRMSWLMLVAFSRIRSLIGQLWLVYRRSMATSRFLFILRRMGQ